MGEQYLPEGKGCSTGRLKEEWQYGSLEEIAAAFASPAVRVISFDIFDTLIVRPMEREEDVFELLDKSFREMSRAQVSFRKLRIEAEAILRRRITEKKILKEDICLDEIYHVLEEQFMLSPEVADAMKQIEIETERRICRCRKSGAMLFQCAQSVGKPIILISDMYLGREQIEAMLDKYGYQGMAGIFISSEMGKRKVTGQLYDAVAKELGEDPAGIFHIGDNRQADCITAVRHGFQAAWLPKALDVYAAHGCAHQVEKICADLTDWEAAEGSVGIGIMRALASIKYFDNPFRPFEKTSDYNGDPYFVGYGALGMELLAVVRWIADNARRDHVKKIIFMSRDGYLPMKAYEKYRAFYPGIPEAQYLHISRLAVLPAMIQSVEDLYDLPMDISYQTPRKLLRLLAFCAKEDTGKGLSAEISMDEPFTKDSYLGFIRDFIQNRYDSGKHRESVVHIAEYLKKNDTAPLTDDAALFDMGYSGRIAAAIVSAADVHPEIYYFHTDSREHFRHEKRMGRKIRAFFDFSPYMESSLREYSYLEPAASCIGYTEDFQPIYDAGPAEGYEKAAAAMQKGALDFVGDYLENFAGFGQETGFRYHDAAMPFEAFLRYCSPYDRKIYRNVLIDDELWGGRRDINLQELMETRIRKIPDYAKK